MPDLLKSRSPAPFSLSASPNDRPAVISSGNALHEDLTSSLAQVLASFNKPFQPPSNVTSDSGYDARDERAPTGESSRLDGRPASSDNGRSCNSFLTAQETTDDRPPSSMAPPSTSELDGRIESRIESRDSLLSGSESAADAAHSATGDAAMFDRFQAGPSSQHRDEMSLWYRNMFKKMHKIDAPEESSVLRHRLREASPALTISRPLTPLSFTAPTPSRHACEVTPRRARSVGRVVEPEMLDQGSSSLAATAEELAELKRISKEELLYRHKAEKLAEELQEQRNRRHGYVPTASPSLVYNKDRFGGLLEEYGGRKSPSPLHATSVRTVTAIFKFDAKSPRELSLNRGDIVRLRREVDANWLEGERNGQSGIFPRSYVQMDDEFDRSRSKLRAVYPFTARSVNELSLKMGEIVTFRREIDENWIEGTNHLGEIGIFPRNYVRQLEDNRLNDVMLTSPDRPKTPKTFEKEEPYSVSKSYSSGAIHEPTTFAHSSNHVDDRLLSSTASSERTLVNDHSRTSRPERNTRQEGYLCTADKIPRGSQTYRALYRYAPTKDDEVALEVDDIIFVVEKCDDGWYIGTVLRTGQFGTFPGNYVVRH